MPDFITLTKARLLKLLGHTGPEFLDLESTQEIKHKTLDFDLNTFLNLPGGVNDVFPGYVSTNTIQSLTGQKTFSSPTKLMINDVNDVPSALPDSTIIKFPSYMFFYDSTGRLCYLNGTSGATTSATSNPTTSTETTSMFNTVLTAMAATGGILYLKGGLYSLTSERAIGSQVTNPNAFIAVIGEGWDNTIIKHDPLATPFTMLRWWCHGLASDFTIDGSGVSGGQLYHGSPTRNWVTRVHFMNAGSGGVGLHTFTTKGIVATNNWFDKTGLQDQMAVGSTDYALVLNNWFDKTVAGTNGSVFGSSLTTGGISNYVVMGNVFRRTPSDIGAAWFTVEPRTSTYNRIVFANNDIEGGTILFGGSNWTTGGFGPSTYNQMEIIGNTITNGRINFEGASGDPVTGSLQNIIIVRNIMKNSGWSLISLKKVTGPTIIQDNIFKDSNSSNGTGGDRGLIYLESCNNLKIANNIFQLTDNSTANTSTYATRSSGGVAGLQYHDNYIINPISRPVLVLETFNGANSNVTVWDNEGYKTSNEGVATFNGTGSQTDFVINHGLAITPTVVIVTPNQVFNRSVGSIGGTSFTVSFSTAPASGTNNVIIYWKAYKKTFA